MKKLSIILLLVWAGGLFKPAHATSSTIKMNNDPRDSTLLNKPAPEFELRDMNGKFCSLGNLKRKIVVLNLGFIACMPCVNEMPVLNRIKKNYDTYDHDDR